MVLERTVIGFVDGQFSHSRFFFQAEDGIRDYKVTGVQTCALPIFQRHQCCTRPPTATQSSKLPAGPSSSCMPYWPWIITGGLMMPVPNTTPAFQMNVVSLRQKCCIVPS